MPRVYQRVGMVRELLNARITIERPLPCAICLTTDPVDFNRYLATQFAWYARATQDTQIAEYHPELWQRAKKGDVNSNYGAYTFIEGQLFCCIKLLEKDPGTRRAVMIFNRPSVVRSATNDHICTTSVQFLLRQGRLHAIVTMRSNELHTSFRADTNFFMVLQAGVAACLGVEVGKYHHNVGSLHISDSNIDKPCHTTVHLWPKFEAPNELEQLLELGSFFGDIPIVRPNPGKLYSYLRALLDSYEPTTLTRP